MHIKGNHKQNGKMTQKMRENICKQSYWQGIMISSKCTRAHTAQYPKNNPIKKWAGDLNSHFSREDTRWSKSTWKDVQHCSLFTSVQLLSHVQLCNCMDCSTPGFPIHYKLPEPTQNSWPFSQWCHPPISSSVVPFSSWLQSFPASGSFPVFIIRER